MDASQTATSGDGSVKGEGPGAAGLPVQGTTATLPQPLPRPGVQFTAGAGDLVEIGATLFQEAENILRGSRKQRLRIRLGSKTLAEIPLAAGAVAVLATAMLAVALTRLTVELE